MHLLVENFTLRKRKKEMQHTDGMGANTRSAAGPLASALPASLGAGRGSEYDGRAVTRMLTPLRPEECR